MNKIKQERFSGKCNCCKFIISYMCIFAEAEMESKRAKSNKDGDFIVALRFLPGIDLVLTILALIKTGLAYVPIAPNWPDGRIKMLLADCQPIWAITNIKADPLYNATSSLEKENKPFPKIFQVCKYFFQYLYITKKILNVLRQLLNS